VRGGNGGNDFAEDWATTARRDGVEARGIPERRRRGIARGEEIFYRASEKIFRDLKEEHIEWKETEGKKLVIARSSAGVKR